MPRHTEPRSLSTAALHDDRFVVVEFLTRFGEVEFMVTDREVECPITGLAEIVAQEATLEGALDRVAEIIAR
jgi:hypothetical protein